MPTRIFPSKMKTVIQQRAKALRNDPTKAEQQLWQKLRNRQLGGYKFRRQHPIDRFIVDFFCYQGKLIIELDGKIHEDPEQKEYDEGRSVELSELGYTVVRFRNEEVFQNEDEVLNTIWRFLD